jgi:zinc protease
MSSATNEISGQSSASDLESLFQLTYLYMTQPREDEELFKSFISKQQAMLQNLMSEPRAVFQDSVLSIVYNHHPRAPKVPRPEDFDKINLSRSLEIYKEQFSNANGYTFILVGAFDVDAMKPLITTYLAGLPASGPIPNYKDIGLRPVTGVVKKKVFSGTESKSFISMQFNGEMSYSRQDRFILQALIEVMNIKLIETLREELSGIYGGGMYGSINRFPYANYSIGISLPCGPENVNKLIEATLGEIDKVKSNGPIEADLNKVKETWKKQFEENIKTNNYWLGRLQNCVENETSFDDILTYEKRVDALTTTDLKTVANKYLDMKNFVQVVLYPENSK